MHDGIQQRRSVTNIFVFKIDLKMLVLNILTPVKIIVSIFNTVLYFMAYGIWRFMYWVYRPVCLTVIVAIIPLQENQLWYIRVKSTGTLPKTQNTYE